MAIFKVFPQQDATIYSYYPAKNAGLDEILEVSLYSNQNTQQGEVSRTLIQFPQKEITDTITKLVSGSNYSASLKLYLADASEIPLDYTLYCYPISGSWNMGTGRAGNSPTSSDGVSWKYAKNNETIIEWPTASFGTGTTGSYSSTKGGGVWYTGSFEATQSFSYQDPKDINLNVTEAVKAWYTGSIDNNGLILKHSSSLEFNYSQSFELKYFSGDTHTIYPPCLEVKWDDFVYTTGSLSIINTDKLVVNVRLKENYQQDSIQRFKVNVREQYPVRTFQTSSVYLNNKLLPTSSYWALKDVDTEEYVIDFDDEFTKISADGTSSYFDVYMNGLQPERYYCILIKTIVGGSTLIINNDNIFKVVR
jgi:hypothetical protein